MEYHKEMSVNEWSSMFRDIYYPVQNYGRSTFMIFTHLVKVFGAGSHYLFRSHNSYESRDYIARVFAWYCALASRLQLDIDDALWQKYPGVCPRCLHVSCQCDENIKNIDLEKLSILSLENQFRRPNSLREWQIMFASIYRGPNGKQDIPLSREKIALIFARISEELGEVAEALLLDGAIDSDYELVVKNEMADLGAWIFALANNLHNVEPSASAASLADIAWDFYPGKCNRCTEVKCVCVRGMYGLELAEKGAMAPSQWDERTGLANDRALRRYLKNADLEFLNGHNYWSYIFIDLDNFGLLNKTHGHSSGDEVLFVTAKRISEEVHKSGITFRRGGEEFVVITRELDHDTSLALAERIRLRIANKPVVVEGGRLSIPVTASVGVASMIGSGTNFKKVSEMETVADANCQEAKKKGKNRVIPIPPTMTKIKL